MEQLPSALEKFDASKHPRDAAGRWTSSEESDSWASENGYSPAVVDSAMDIARKTHASRVHIGVEAAQTAAVRSFHNHMIQHDAKYAADAKEAEPTAQEYEELFGRGFRHGTIAGATIGASAGAALGADAGPTAAVAMAGMGAPFGGVLLGVPLGIGTGAAYNLNRYLHAKNAAARINANPALGKAAEMTGRVDAALDRYLAKEAPGQPFDESKHPRAEHGRFGHGSGGSNPGEHSSGWSTAGKVAAGVAGVAAAGAAAYYGSRYLAAHPDVVARMKATANSAYQTVKEKVRTPGAGGKAVRGAMYGIGVSYGVDRLAGRSHEEASNNVTPWALAGAASNVLR